MPASAPANPGDPLVTLLSWNVWIGRGRLREVIARLREGGYEKLGIPAEVPLVAVVQEAYRADDSVPPVSSGAGPRERPREFRPEEDIVDVARELRLNVRYVPSMRNGAHRSDRGNAILSTLPLSDDTAIELPFVLQRRVAVGATVRIGDAAAAPGLRVYSAHLDPWGAVGRDWLGAAGRVVQCRSLLAAIESRRDPTLPEALGADLNTSRGRREGAYRLLTAAGFTAGVPHHPPSWGHTYHVVPRLSIDYLLFRSSGWIASARVHRLNENPRDAGPFVFGSDHHPLMGAVQLIAAGATPGATDDAVGAARATPTQETSA